jgi:Protein of unknown function (DUF2975)
MTGKRPDRLVRGLTVVVTVAYYGFWIGALAILIAVPVAKAIGADHEWTFDLPVPVNVRESGATVATSWGAAQIELDDVRADLQLPISMLPWWFLSILWLYVALQAGPLLLTLYHLRRMCQSVRDGAPFDPDNAVRLRSVGLLLCLITVFSGVAQFLTSTAVNKGLTDSTIDVQRGFHLNGAVIIVGLVLVALAEIFRRGAELETEQSLV